MDNFFTIIPFLLPLWFLYIAYKQYQDKKAGRLQKRTSKFEKYEWYKYLRIIYVERGVVKFWSAIWYFPLLLSSALFIVGLSSSMLNYIFPAVHLSEMNYEKGVIQSISVHRRSVDSLILKKEDGSLLDFYIRIHGNEQEELVGKPVRIYYALTRIGTGFFDQVYEVMLDKKSIREFPYSYDDEVYLRSNITLTKNSFIVMILCVFLIWIQNRKEKPYHRLYRLQRYKKLKKIFDIEEGS